MNHSKNADFKGYARKMNCPTAKNIVPAPCQRFQVTGQDFQGLQGVGFKSLYLELKPQFHSNRQTLENRWFLHCTKRQVFHVPEESRTSWRVVLLLINAMSPEVQQITGAKNHYDTSFAINSIVFQLFH